MRLVSGQGALRDLAILEKSSRIALLTSESHTNRGTTEFVQGVLKDRLIYTYDKVKPFPDVHDVQELQDVLASEFVSAVIGIGGGSVMDTAKSLSLTLAAKTSIDLPDLLKSGRALHWENSLPLVLVPTTSGTGSEVTPFATLWDKTNKLKYSLHSPQAYADIALLDPGLTFTQPEDVTLYSGLDAVSHSLESIWNINRTDFSEMYSWRALELATDALDKLLHDPSSTELRSKMQLSSTLAGIAISQTKTAIAHSISYPLTSHFGIPHGLACSFSLANIADIYRSQYRLSEEKNRLLEKALLMLDGFGLKERINEYCSYHEMDKLRPEMFHKQRAGNYCGNFDQTLDAILGS